MESIIANELNYKMYDYSHSTYQLTQIFQNTGLPYLTLTQSGGSDSVFQIPNCAFNLSQSYLNFSLNPSVVSGGNTTYWVYVDGITPIRQLQLYTDNGLYLADIYDLCNYTNMIFRYTTKFEELTSLDVPFVSTTGLTSGTAATLNDYGCSEGLFPLGKAVGTTRPTGWSPYLGAAATVNTNYTNFYEPAYVVSSGAINEISPYIMFKIPLRKIKHTIFGIDKTMKLNKILYLRIVWNTTNKIAYCTTGAAAAITNPGSIANGTPAAIPGGIYISNLYLYLAKELNTLVDQELTNKINSAEGFKILVPWVSQFKQSIQASGMNNVTMRFTNALGRKLQKIYWTPYNASESLQLAYDHNVFPTENSNSVTLNQTYVGTAAAVQKIQYFYTLLNNTRTSQYNYNVNNGSSTNGNQYFSEDYDARKNKLKGSCILSKNEYYYNWVWCEDFTDNVALADKPLSADQDNFSDGLDLTNEIKYDIFINQGGTTNVAVNLYVYAVTLKELTVNSTGVTFI